MANTSILAAFERMWQHIVAVIGTKADASDITNLQAQLDSKKSLRTTRITVGTATAGWTSSDCDYLCDGAADDVEINAAIAALPSSGGEIVILDGTYNISSVIVLSGTHITLQGSNGATKFVRAFKGSSSAMGVIVVSGSYCTIQGLSIDGAMGTYTGNYHSGIYVSGGNNNFIENDITNNYTSSIYITTANASYNTINKNKCNNNNNNGIYNNSTNICNIISDNTCNSNGAMGIYIGNSGKNTITGNICITNGTNGIGLYTDNSTVSGNVCNENTGNGLYAYGKNNGVSGNTFNSNGTYGVQMGGSSSGNSFAGNTFESNTSGDISEAGSNIVAVTDLTDLGLTATAAELNYCDGVTSNIQTQLNGKANASNLTASDGTVFRFGVNEEGKFGYIVTDSEGADSVIPFSSGGTAELYEALQYSGLVTSDMTFEEMCAALSAAYPAVRYIVQSGSYDSSVGGGYYQFRICYNTTAAGYITNTFDGVTLSINNNHYGGAAGIIYKTPFKNAKKVHIVLSSANQTDLLFFVSTDYLDGIVARYQTEHDGKIAGNINVVQSTTASSTNTIYTLDVSSISGDFYVGFGLSDMTTNATERTFTVKDLYVEY